MMIPIKQPGFTGNVRDPGIFGIRGSLVSLWPGGFGILSSPVDCWIVTV